MLFSALEDRPDADAVARSVGKSLLDIWNRLKEEYSNFADYFGKSDRKSTPATGEAQPQLFEHSSILGDRIPGKQGRWRGDEGRREEGGTSYCPATQLGLRHGRETLRFGDLKSIEVQRRREASAGRGAHEASSEEGQYDW